MSDRRPHSRACGPTPHDHGILCHSNCLVCGGRRRDLPGCWDCGGTDRHSRQCAAYVPILGRRG
jgi:hypothetical protein